jgi:dTDP-4-amino-4,6-dideoxygalactose transaminase
MNIPFIDFSEQYNAIKDKIDPALKSVFQRGAFILGQEEKDFEKDFANYCGVTYGVGVNSGTDALYLALSALDIKPGDEVILPSFTFIATSLCVSYCGAKPVFVDVDDVCYNMDPVKLKAAITPKTKAVIVVHLYGQTADMDEILAIAKEHNLAVVEDAAQAHGTAYKGRKAGSMGDVACFSFYPTKGLGGFGDGGMVITKDEKIYEKVMMLRDYGRKGRYEHVMKGHNSRLDTVQAVILAAKLPFLDEWNAMRQKHAACYEKLLAGAKDIITPIVKSGRIHTYQTYAVRLKERDRISDGLRAKGVGVLIHYPIPVHLQPAYSELGYKKGDLPVSEQLADEVLSLPMFPHITNEQIEYVCASLKELL